MELIPQEELKNSHGFNLAPMIDFLFLMLSLFATLTISRAALYDAEVQLIQLRPDAGATPSRLKQEVQQIHLSIDSLGGYKWLTEFQQYPMSSTRELQEELARQYQIGILETDKEKTEILLHIDRKAPWESIATALFAIRELGFSVHPVYEPME